jgi:hypothetical protein
MGCMHMHIEESLWLNGALSSFLIDSNESLKWKQQKNK